MALFLDFNENLRQNFHYATHIRESQTEDSSKNKVNITLQLLVAIQVHFNNCIIIRYHVSDITYQVPHFSFFNDQL